MTDGIKFSRYSIHIQVGANINMHNKYRKTDALYFYSHLNVRKLRSKM